MAEDGYEEQIIIPKEERDLAAKEGISTENKQKVTVQIMNLKTGESYVGRLAITGNQQTRLPPARHRKLRRGGRVARHERAGLSTSGNTGNAKGVGPACHSS